MKILSAHVEENFINWDDDAEMMQALVLNYFNKPAQTNFNDILSKEKWDFAKEFTAIPFWTNQLIHLN